MAFAESTERGIVDLLGGSRQLEKSPGRSMKFVLMLCLLMIGCAAPERQVARGKKAQRRAARREALSPIGGYVIAAETPDRRSPQRDIIIKRPGEEREILRYPFVRNVDVVWAPDESALAVVDLILENETRVVVFKLPSGQAVFELRREHVCELNPELPCGTAYSHVYFSNVVWLAPDRIQVTVDMVNPLERNLPPQMRGVVVATFGP